MAATSQYDVLVNIDANLSNLTNNLNRVGSNIQGLAGHANRTSGIISQAFAFAGGLGLTSLIEKIGSKFIEAGKMGWDFNSQMQQNLASFKTMLGGSDEAAKKMIDTLMNMAATTPFETTDLTQAATTLMGFGIEANKVEKTLKMLGDASQGNTEKFKSLTLAFAQIQAGGKLTGGDLLQLVNAGFNPLQTISKQTGESMAVLKEKMSEGAISADMVTKAFEAATSQGGLFYGSMEAQSKTFEGQMSTLRDNFSMTFGKIMQGTFENISNNVLPEINKKLGIFQETLNDTGSITTAITKVIESFGIKFDKITSTILPPLKKAFDDISRQVMPVLKRVFDTFINKVLPDIKNGFNTIVTRALPIFNDAIKFITERIVPPMLKIFEFFYTEIVPRLTKAFSENAPKIMNILQGLWDGIKVVMDLILKIFDATWPAIKNIFIGFVDSVSGLTNGLLDIFQGIINFIVGVFTGDWERAWNGIKEFFAGIFESFYAIAGGMVDVGVNIVKGLWEGISSVDDWLRNKVKDFVASIGKTITEFFGIASPSKLTTSYGVEIVNGIAVGITKTQTKAEKAMESLNKKVKKANEKIIQDTADIMTKLGDSVLKALNKQYDKEEKLQLKSLQNQTDMIRNQTDIRIAQYDKEFLARLKILNDGFNEEIKKLQDKIDALDEATEAEERALKEQEYQERYSTLQKRITAEEDAVKRLELQKDLNDLIIENERYKTLEQRKIQQDAYKLEIETIQTQLEDKKTLLKKEYESKKNNEKVMADAVIESLSLQMESVTTHYENLRKEEAIQAEARKLILSQNNADMIYILNEYAPEWKNAGKSFGENLLEGMQSKEAELTETVARMMNIVNNAKNFVVEKLPSISISSPKTVSSVPKFADGTNYAPGGLALVGERGPELVNLPRGSQVTPNNALGNVNITIGTLVGSNGMTELANILSRKLNKSYTAAVGGGVY